MKVLSLHAFRPYFFFEKRVIYQGKYVLESMTVCPLVRFEAFGFILQIVARSKLKREKYV